MNKYFYCYSYPLKEFLINDVRMYIVEEMIRETFEIPPKKFI